MPESVFVPRILIAAPASGSGKTLFACGLMKAFLNRGLSVYGCKCGPDYIDPLFHKTVLHIPSRNLDSFFMDQAMLSRTLAGCRQADITIIEGVMGYYDGLGGFQTEASTYDIAEKTNTPAVLLLPCKGMSLSAAAVLKGFLHYKKDSKIAGVVFNRISPKIYAPLKQAIENDPEIPAKVLGYLPERNDFHLESRHLGLVTPEEMEHFDKQFNILAEQIEETVDLDGIKALAEKAEPVTVSRPENDFSPVFTAKQTPAVIAVAKDNAFCFYYEETLELLTSFGAHIVFFSPCHDSHLPENTKGLCLGGGYPELYAPALSANRTLREEIRKAVTGGLPCIAECGGFMYLHTAIQDNNGISYPMCDIISGTCFPEKKLGRFGYLTLTSQKDTAFLPKGKQIRGHEFHYWESENNGSSFLAEKPSGNKSWECIHSTDTLLAGYPHFSFVSNPELLFHFYQKATEYN